MVRKISVPEREALLAAAHVSVLSVAAEPGRAPLTTPIWHSYTPGGEVTVLTTPHLRKARLIDAAGRFALCVLAPGGLRYVSVEGPVTGVRPVTEADRLAMAEHYLPAETAAGYVRLTYDQQSGNVAITMRPERWNTGDFGDVTEALSN
ncbi:pyridoxamine 5'-phosphate oxidase family protein [Amycolatopsis ultiminotia]|uniref:Pyridoxamine 5'-phosphate oxidase family protein n=1 Tax=Amycolatopsis ultiminotia TaxID=543629 RepID=A0ABP6WMC7_9PSEU